jgi:hypothetical protein
VLLPVGAFFLRCGRNLLLGHGWPPSRLPMTMTFFHILEKMGKN